MAAAVLHAAKNRRKREDAGLGSQDAQSKGGMFSKEEEMMGSLNMISPDTADWQFSPATLMGVMPREGR